MITLDGVKLNQKGYILYLASATIGDINNWYELGHFFADIWKREKEDGYQREPDKQRVMEIAGYIEGKLRIEETILPGSVILNIRQKGTIEFAPTHPESQKDETIQLGRISIPDEALPFCEVDGQHRIRGLIEAYRELKSKKDDKFEEIKSYPVPFTIIEGLDRATEAIQFVVINTTQKKVDPALVLRILHKRFRDKSERLEFFLKGTWRLWAVEICDQLNSDPNSPWCEKIIAPGDVRKGRVISDQNFVNSLETVYPKLEPDIDIVKAYLPLYWKAISNLWPECTGDNAVKYSLQRTNGINAFHWLFPYIYFKSVSLGHAKLKDFIQNLKPVRKKFDLSFWKRGGEAKVYTSRGGQRELVDRMIATTLPGKGFKLDKLDKSLKGTKTEKIWDIASRLIPFRSYNLFTGDKLNRIDTVATGVYILYSFTKHKFYVGRSEKTSLKLRLQKHLQNKENEFHIFNYRLCKEPKEAHDLECALYHLLPNHLLMNKEHPSAFEGRKCPFCVTSVLV